MRRNTYGMREVLSGYEGKADLRRTWQNTLSGILAYFERNVTCHALHG